MIIGYDQNGDPVTVNDQDWTGVGPQQDGTYVYPIVAQPSNLPWDVGGVPSGDYSSDVIDLVKYGIGVWSQDRTRKQAMDYRRFEATQGGVFQQGAQAIARGSSGGVDMRVIAGAAAILLLMVLITRRK